MGKISVCNCINSYQDLLYGKGKRYFNSRKKDRKLLGYVCTSCGRKTEATSEEKKSEEPKGKENEPIL